MNNTPEDKTITFNSTRFGELTIRENAIILLPYGLIGFPRATRYIMIDHKEPFSWLQSVDEPSLAFVVIDGFDIGQKLEMKPPYGDKECDFQENDEYAILVIVTVRPNPTDTTANLKAPLFVNMKNRKGVQVIFDDPKYSTRHPLWDESSTNEEAGKKVEENDSRNKDAKKETAKEEKPKENEP